MKIDKKITVNGVEMSYDDLKADLKSFGLSETKFVDREPATMPKEGEFVEFKKEGEGEFKHVRMIAKGTDGKLHEISLSRLQAYGLEKKSNSVLKPENLRKSAKGNLYIAGETINPEISTDQAKAIIQLIGTKFNAKPLTLFALPFGQEFETKEQAIENATVRNGFKVTLQN